MKYLHTMVRATDIDDRRILVRSDGLEGATRVIILTASLR